MPIDIKEILERSRGRNFEVFEKHIGPQWAKVLRTIGFNRSYVGSSGPHLFDSEGRKYLDFMSGWGVFNFGRNHPDIVSALDQVLKSDFPGWIAFDAPALAGALAEELAKRMPPGLDVSYFCNSGTECVEAALKYARHVTGRHHVIHVKKSFHGLTNGSLSINGDDSFREGFGPFLPTPVEIKLNDFDDLEQAFARQPIAAFVFEPIQGKGVFVAQDDWLLRAQALCHQHGALMIADEVQTGMGRTGKFLACEWVPGLEPDMVLLSKALSGGYVPVGAVVTRRAIHDKVFPNMNRAMAHACTFGMGNMAMAAGLASLRVLDDYDLLARANRLGEAFRSGLEAMKPRFEMMGEIRQRGLMIGIEFKKPDSLILKTAWNAIHAMDKSLFPQAVVIPLFDDHRILTQVAGHAIDVVKLLPPLVIDDSDVRWFLDAFEKVMTDLHRFPGPVWEIVKKLGKHALTARSREKAEQEV